MSLFMSRLVEDENLLKMKKIGVISIEYTIKYKMVGISLFIAARLTIHPIWVMEEYAIIDRR